MHNHVSWQQASPCLSSFRGLRASTKHSSVQDNKGESDSSPQVSVAGLTTGAQGNPSPCIDIYLFIFFHWTIMEKKKCWAKKLLANVQDWLGTEEGFSVFLFACIVQIEGLFGFTA